jgi:glycine/D-amino acid oxidase-like deaminating enzyme
MANSSGGNNYENQDSLWASTAEPTPSTPPLSGDRRADVAVIGAGFTGLRAALTLAEAGSDTVVLEAAESGWGASGRTGGQVNPLLPENTPESIAAMIGGEAAEKLCRLAMDSADELFALIQRTGIHCDPRQEGWLRVAHCRSAARTWTRQCESWIKAGADIEIFEGERLASLTGSRVYTMGSLARRGGAVQPLSLARGLADKAIAAGAVIHGSTPALSLERGEGRWTVTTPGGSVVADKVLLCTNGYTDKLWPGLAKSVVSLTAVQVASEPLPDAVRDSILPGGQTFSDTRRTILYGRREPEGQLLLGSIGQDDAGTAADFKRIHREAVRVFPQLADVKWRYQWGGRVAMTEDHLPHLHEPAPGLLVGFGYNGRGVAMGTIMGRVLAERALGKDPADLPFPITPVRSYPFGAFTGIGIPLAIAWMAMRDRIDRIIG